MARAAAFLAGTPPKSSYAENVMPYQELAKMRAIKKILRTSKKSRRKQ
ncbi:MAG TPA: hypothetical protein VI874_02210 [Candidatus Norongarragalinales archaeon]|nr:hypothetical protein [Candidatus Norongarragalinales archaeon]